MAAGRFVIIVWVLMIFRFLVVRNRISELLGIIWLNSLVPLLPEIGKQILPAFPFSSHKELENLFIRCA